MILTLSLRDGAIYLSSEILEALGYPRHIQILINAGEKKLLIRPCMVDEKEAVVIPAEHYLQIEIGARALLKKIYKILEWDDDITREVKGMFYIDAQGVIFALEEAVPVTAPGQSE